MAENHWKGQKGKKPPMLSSKFLTNSIRILHIFSSYFVYIGPSKRLFNFFFFTFRFTLKQRLCILNLVILLQLWRNFTFEGPKRQKKGPKRPLKNDFFNFFSHISFYIGTEAMYSKFGDPMSIIAEFHFWRPKKAKNAPKRPPKTTFSHFSVIFRFTLAQKLCIPNLVILSQLWHNLTFEGPKKAKNAPKRAPKTNFSIFFVIFRFTLALRLCIANLVILSQLQQNFTFDGPKR